MIQKTCVTPGLLYSRGAMPFVLHTSGPIFGPAFVELSPTEYRFASRICLSALALAGANYYTSHSAEKFIMQELDQHTNALVSSGRFTMTGNCLRAAEFPVVVKRHHNICEPRADN